MSSSLWKSHTKCRWVLSALTESDLPGGHGLPSHPGEQRTGTQAPGSRNGIWAAAAGGVPTPPEGLPFGVCVLFSPWQGKNRAARCSPNGARIPQDAVAAGSE